MERAKKSLNGLGEVIADVAKIKRDFAAKAFQRADESIEPPRDVFRNACLTIAESFAQRGFKFLKSDPLLARKRGDWTDRVCFLTNHYNVRGSYVELEVTAIVANTRVKKLRQSGQSPFAYSVTWGSIAGRQIGDPSNPNVWITWNLADPADREAIIADVVAHIDQVALPFFERFESYAALASGFFETEIEGIDACEVIDLLICYEGPAAAARYVDRWCEWHPGLVPHIAAELAQMQRRGRPERPSGSVEIIAAAIMFYALPVTRVPTE